MYTYSIGIIGNGCLGGSIARGFALTNRVTIYDKNPQRCINTLEEVCSSDIVFLCLPSPMTHKEGGKTNLSIIRSACEMIASYDKPIYVLKSTVPIGTTANLSKDFNMKIVHNPEFLTARNSDIDFLTSNRTILGGLLEWTVIVGQLFSERFPGQNIMYMKSNESEAVKYIINAFFATKVMFFNEVRLGLESHYNLDWKRVMQGVLSDGRIGISHYDVPGHDGQYGYGGACFCKDICSLIEQIQASGFDPSMLKANWEHNKILRPDMDWANIPGVVSDHST